ncbi:hypothetical protein M513_11809, partial [Trichuris suis]
GLKKRQTRADWFNSLLNTSVRQSYGRAQQRIVKVLLPCFLQGVCLQVLLFLASWALLRQSLCSDKVTLAWNFDGSATETDLELLVNPSREVIIFLLPEFSLASLSRLSDAYLQSSDGGILKNFKNLVESGGKKVLLNEPLTSKVLDHPSLSRIPSNEVFEIARWKRLSRVALKLTSWNDLGSQFQSIVAQICPVCGTGRWQCYERSNRVAFRCSFYSQDKKVVVNLSSETLNDMETSVLAKGLNFVPTPKAAPLLDIVASVESSLGPHIPAQQAAEIRGAFLDTLTQRNIKAVSNITGEERRTLKTLRQKTQLVITKADKGNVVVVLDKKMYVQKITELLNGAAYTAIQDDPTENVRKTLRSLLEYFEHEAHDKEISKIRNHIYYISNTRCPELYGLPKIHKPEVPLRPVVSSIKSVTARLASYLKMIIRPLTGNRTSAGHVVWKSKMFFLFLGDPHYDELLQSAVRPLDLPSLNTLLRRKGPEESSTGVKRDIRANADSDYTFVNISGGECLLYASGVSFVVQQAVEGKLVFFEYPLPPTSLRASGNCSNYMGSILLFWSPFTVRGQRMNNFRLSLAFDRANSEWYLANVSLSADGNMIEGKKLEYFFNGSEVHRLQVHSVPAYSFACGKPKTWMIPSGLPSAKNHYGVVMAFRKCSPFEHFISLHCNQCLSPNRQTSAQFTNGLAIQPFRSGYGFTDQVDDCSEFFSAEAWMAIFSVACVFVITVFGVAMISSLTTMDRFDDPKGKPLVINAKE